MKPIIAITIGDFNGIGPEIALKAAANASVKKICTPLLVGPLDVFGHVRSDLRLKLKLEKSSLPVIKSTITPVFDTGDGIWGNVQYGAVTKSSGKNAGVAIERAVELCLKVRADAMVTAPVSKEALNLAGYNFPGQTEMIALLSRSQRVAMMLVSDSMRVGLVTIHVGIKSIPEHISKDKIVEKILTINDSLMKDFRVRKPRIAVLALNPHAGEKGLMGTEDDEFVLPAVKEVKAKGINVEGPFPADAFFGKQSHKEFSAVVAMYHDQGLIPLKMSSFGKGVNFSAGLNIVRTSPDHGTAYDIAGKGKASASSMIEAIKLAVTISKNRQVS
ncbi:MAG TPA: 4-hydroxythreonine-4-phosphate dehydrogenase PdxA [Bacteroidota bacterium]